MGNTAMDVIDKKRSLAQGLRHYGTHALKQAGNTLVEQQLRQNLPVLNAPLIGPILNKTLMPLVKRKVNTAIENAVNKVLGQRGKGLVTNLLKVGAKGVGPLMKSEVKAVLSRGVTTIAERCSTVGENGGGTSHSQCCASRNRHLKRKKMSKKRYNREVHKALKEPMIK